MSEALEYFPTGSQLLDCILGGGWCSNILINIQGDSQSGKTLLAQEAAANYLATWPKGVVSWRDAEKAFNFDYARTLGIPIDKIDFLEDIFTIEDLFNCLEGMLDAADENSRGLFILDSLDALSDEAEMERDIKEGSYGGNKAKKMSELFRRLNAKLSHKKITVMIIQQLRDVLNSPIPMKKASGGHGPEFYASQTVKLREAPKGGKLKRTAGGVERIIGSVILAKCTKNRVGMPFRECEFKVRFGYGIDDIESNLDFLESVKATEALGKITPIGESSPTKNITTFCKKAMELSSEEHQTKRKEIATITKEVWDEIEARFAIGVSKY